MSMAFPYVGEFLIVFLRSMQVSMTAFSAFDKESLGNGFATESDGRRY